MQPASDLAAIAVLTLLPVVVYGIPAAAGHPILNGDNLIQNYPLRVLAGRDISDGSAPLWNPYIWGGSPLLAGWNAGAMYPFTALFAIMGSTAAWALNQIALYVVAALGIYTFCRIMRLVPLASFLAALSFGFAGAMGAQVVHIGLVAGAAWIPWMLVALEKIAQWRRAPWGWIALLASAGALTILAGEPRAISDAVVVCLVYGLWLLFRTHKRAAFTTAVVLAGAWAVCLGALQWIPGLQFLHESQRSNATYADFSAGSLPLSWTALLVVPDLLGGSGSFGQPKFLGLYSLTEVTSYIGLLPVMAVFALLVRSRWPGAKARASRHEWAAWYVIAAVGLVLAYGGNTFFGRLLWNLPLYGGQRLQSRNLLIVDLALALIFAYWVDDLLSPGGESPAPAGEIDESLPEPQLREAIHALRARLRDEREQSRLFRWLDSATARAISVTPAAVGVLMCVLGLCWGPGFARHFTDTSATGIDRDYRNLIPSLVVSLLLCMGAGLIVVYHGRFGRRLLSGVLATFVAIDLLVFAGLSLAELSGSVVTHVKSEVSEAIGDVPVPGTSGRVGTGASPGQVSSPTPGSMPGGGRFAIFDPDLINTDGLSQVGQPDLNILRATYGIQGYGSIAPGTYATETGTHGQDVLSPEALYSGRLAPLDLRYIYTLPRYLVQPLTGSQSPSGQSWVIGAYGSRGWFFGTTLDVSAFDITDLVERSIPPGAFVGIKVGLVLPDGSVDWSVNWVADEPGEAFMGANPPVEAIGIEIRDLSAYPSTVSDLVVTSASGRDALEGPLSGFLDPDTWSYLSAAFGYQLYESDQPSVVARVEPDIAGAAGSWSIVGGSITGTVTVEVTTPVPSTFVRSVSYVPGWRATLAPVSSPPAPPGTGGPGSGGRAPTTTRPPLQSSRAPFSEPVLRDGLVQSVRIPAGSYRVSLDYSPPRMAEATALTVAGLVVLVLVLIVIAAEASDRRHHQW